VWFNLANAYLKLGKKEEAIAALKRTLALNPDVTAARSVSRIEGERQEAGGG
jgi:tetratricopeptide (TPR) repeat protein